MRTAIPRGLSAAMCGLILLSAAVIGVGCGGGGDDEDTHGQADVQTGDVDQDAALPGDVPDSGVPDSNREDTPAGDVDLDALDVADASCEPCTGGAVCIDGECRCGQDLVYCNGECVETVGGEVVETCNGLDDNCDGQTDEGTVAGQPCDGGDSDLCAEGVWVCSAAGQACTDVTGDSVEICNGADDNCDGTTDEGFNVGQACDGPDSDLCAEGLLSCAAEGEVCTDTSDDTIDVCNGVDDDCDGTTDNRIGSCDSPGDLDLCATGTWGCQGDEYMGYYGYCDDDDASTLEVCGNGIDDDCDGATDEGVGYYVDFTNRGSFTAQYIEDGKLIVSGSNTLNVLQLNGIGVVAGVDDTAIEVGESVIFEIAPPATHLVLIPQFGATCKITAWGTSENLLGSVETSGYMIDVTDLFSQAAFNQIMYEIPSGYGDRIAAIAFETHCP